MAQAAAKAARPAPKKVFKERFILKFTRITDTKLELAGGAIKFVRGDGDTVIQPQGAEVRDVQADAQTPVVEITAVEGIRAGRHGADVIKQGDTQAGAGIFFHDGDAVFHRAEPVAVATDGFVKIRA